jgi:hypothetical protein
MSTAHAIIAYAVNAERERRLAELVVEVGGVAYDADRPSRDNLAGLLVAHAAGVPVPWPIPWRCADDVVRPLDHAGATALSAAILQAIQGIYAASWSLKDETIPGLSPAEVRALDVTADGLWPV